MATQPKIEFAQGPIDIGKPSAPRYRTAIGADGEPVKVRIVDPNSPTFTADFLSMFRANVKHARAENKALGLDV